MPAKIRRGKPRPGAPPRPVSGTWVIFKCSHPTPRCLQRQGEQGVILEYIGGNAYKIISLIGEEAVLRECFEPTTDHPR